MFDIQHHPAIQAAQAANLQYPRQRRQLQALTDSFAPYTEKWNEAEGFGESAKVIGGMIGNVAKQAVTNPKGMAYATAEQAANMAPAMADPM